MNQLPTSAWNVLAVLNDDCTLKMLTQRVDMSSRTIRYALAKLHTYNDIDVIVNLRDMRGRIYRRR